MRILLLCATLLILLTMPGSAQEKVKGISSNSLSIGVEESLPLGDFAVGYSFGTGGSAQIEHKASGKVGFTLNAGYIHYFIKSNLVFQAPQPGLGLIPVLAGVKLYLTPKLYAHAQLGAAFSDRSGGGTFFTYTPALGFVISKAIDAMLKFEGFARKNYTNNALALRVAYNFRN